jgi:hypothetical protein
LENIFSIKKYYPALDIIMSFLFLSGYAQEIQHKGYAPDDAYLKGSEFPYYGSENPWDRRFFTEHLKDKYKRRGQRQMLDIVEGKPAEALDYCRELLDADPMVRYEIVNIDNEFIHSITLRESEISYKLIRRVINEEESGY